MPIVNANRVRENTTGNGTGALALLGAVTNYQTFLSGVGNGNQCYYAITHQTKNEWEVGLGTFTLSAGIPYLSRNTVYNSSNGNLLVDFTAGTKQCAVVYPGTQIDTIASNVGVAAGYANDANTYAQLASTAAVNANIYRVSAAAEATQAGIYAAAASVSYVDAASAAAYAASVAAQVSSVATEASLALVAASLAQVYKTSASAYATEAGGYASVAQVYKVSASAYATDAANQASIANVAAVSANNAASIAGVYANTASVAAVSANNAASIAGVYANTASVAAVSANNAASIANVAANNASIAAVSANNAASLAAYYAGLINPSTYAVLTGTNTFTGANTFTSVVNVQSNLSVTGNAFVSGVTTLASSVDIEGATSLASTLVTNGNATFNSNVSVSGTFLVSGVATLASAVDIKGATSLASTLLVNGNAVFNSNVSVSGTFTVSEVANLLSAVNLRGNTSVGGTLITTGNATFAGNVSVSGTFTVSGVANLLSAVNLRGNTSIGGTLITTGNVTFAANVSVSGVLVVGAGAVGAPSYSTTGDTNTGLFFPAADTVAVATSAVERMRIDASGNVGIGTISPGQKLTVAGTVESTSGGFKFPDGTTQSSAASGGVVTGTILDYGGITAPSGYLFCDGSAVSRTTYATLWSTLNASSTVTITIASPGVVTWTSHPLQNGDPIRLQTTGALPTGLTANTTYYVVSAAANTFSLATSRGGTAINTSGTQSGVHTAIYAPWGWGDNSTTFNVPDLRGRAGIGRDNMGGTAASRITTAGSGIAGVNLGDAGGAQTVTLTTTEMPAHTHTGALGVGSFVAQGACGSGGNVNTGSTGGGAAHQNTQPSAIVNKIIKT
jgi:microcystin-dependent protein